MKKILIITAILSILLSNPVKIYALNPDRAEEVDRAAATRNASSKTTISNPANTNMPSNGKPILTPPLGNGTAGGSDLKTIFLNVIDVAQTIMIMITTLYLIFAGFMFVIAKGDPGKIKTARDALLWGLVGAALILCAEVLAHGIGDTVKEVFKGK